MNTDEVKSAYKRDLPEPVAIRRYTGTGAGRTFVDYASVGRVMQYQPHELVATIRQGDRKAIVYADDLSANGLTLPVKTSDSLVVNGKVLAIVGVDDETRSVNGVLVAYELQVRGQ